MGMVRIGTSGYSFRSWKGTVYPPTIKESQMLSYYINEFKFNTVEINYTYYHQPSAKTMASLAQKTPEGFDFTVKLFGGITHEPFRSGIPEHVDTSLSAQFTEGIAPLKESGKLGCVLAQFPPGMPYTPKTWNYLLSLKESFHDVPLVFEFRNRAWASNETFERLREADIGFCAVDCPPLESLMPLIPEVTSKIAYLRLHGRNPNWFKEPFRRYDYVYTTEELEQLLGTIREMASRSDKMYIAFNNCHAGAALRNAKALQEMIDNQ